MECGQGGGREGGGGVDLKREYNYGRVIKQGSWLEYPEPHSSLIASDTVGLQPRLRDVQCPSSPSRSFTPVHPLEQP